MQHLEWRSGLAQKRAAEERAQRMVEEVGVLFILSVIEGRVYASSTHNTCRLQTHTETTLLPPTHHRPMPPLHVMRTTLAVMPC